MTAIVMARTIHTGAGAHATTITRPHSIAGFILVHHGLLLGREALVENFSSRSNLLEHVGTNFHVLGAEAHRFFTIGRTLAILGFMPGIVLACDVLTAGNVLVERLLGRAGQIHGLSQFGIIGTHLFGARCICRGRGGVRSGKSHSGKTGDCCKGNCCKGSLHFHNQPQKSNVSYSVKAPAFWKCCFRKAAVSFPVSSGELLFSRASVFLKVNFTPSPRKET